MRDSREQARLDLIFEVCSIVRYYSGILGLFYLGKHTVRQTTVSVLANALLHR